MVDFIDRNTLLTEQVRLAGSSRVDQLITESNGYIGSFSQSGVAVDDTTYFVLKTGAIPVGLEEIITVSDFSNVTSGRMIINISMYVADSNGNTWSYGAGGTDLPVGRNLNAADINKLPISTITVNPADVSIAGVADYELQFSEYFIEVQGNRETLSTNSTGFFDAGRKVLMPANSEFLFVSAVTGDAAGTATNRSIFFTSELPDLV